MDGKGQSACAFFILPALSREHLYFYRPSQKSALLVRVVWKPEKQSDWIPAFGVAATTLTAESDMKTRSCGHILLFWLG